MAFLRGPTSGGLATKTEKPLLFSSSQPPAFEKHDAFPPLDASESKEMIALLTGCVPPTGLVFPSYDPDCQTVLEDTVFLKTGDFDLSKKTISVKLSPESLLSSAYGSTATTPKKETYAFQLLSASVSRCCISPESEEKKLRIPLLVKLGVVEPPSLRSIRLTGDEKRDTEQISQLFKIAQAFYAGASDVSSAAEAASVPTERTRDAVVAELITTGKHTDMKLVFSEADRIMADQDAALKKHKLTSSKAQASIVQPATLPVSKLKLNRRDIVYKHLMAERKQRVSNERLFTRLDFRSDVYQSLYDDQTARQLLALTRHQKSKITAEETKLFMVYDFDRRALELLSEYVTHVKSKSDIKWGDVLVMPGSASSSPLTRLMSGGVSGGVSTDAKITPDRLQKVCIDVYQSGLNRSSQFHQLMCGSQPTFELVFARPGNEDFSDLKGLSISIDVRLSVVCTSEPALKMK